MLEHGFPDPKAANLFGQLGLSGGKWVFPKIMATPKWMVYKEKPELKMDDLGGPPLCLETPI